MRHRVHANYASFEDTKGNHNLLDPYNSTVIDYLQSDGTTPYGNIDRSIFKRPYLSEYYELEEAQIEI